LKSPYQTKRRQCLWSKKRNFIITRVEKPEGKEKRAEEIRNMLRTQNKSTETSVIVEK
jgi:hypothetical protein